MTDDCRQFPLSGHAFFCRQLNVLLFFVWSAGTLVMSSRCVCCGCLFRVVHAALTDLDIYIYIYI